MHFDPWIPPGRPAASTAIATTLLATLLLPCNPARAQEFARLAGQPIAVRPEFEPEDLPAAIGLENAAGSLTIGGGTQEECVAYSPDGKILAVGDGPNWPICSRGAPPINENGGLIRLVDTATDRVLATLMPVKFLGHEYGIDRLAFLADGASLVAQGFDQWREDGRLVRSTNVTIWDTATGRPRRIVEDSAANPWYGSIANAIDPVGGRVAFALEDGTVRIYEAASGAVRSTFVVLGHPADPDDRVTALLFSPDGATLAVGDQRGEVGLWGVVEGRWLVRFPAADEGGKQPSIGELAFSPDGSVLAAESSSYRAKGRLGPIADILFIDVKDRREIVRAALADGEMIYCMRFSPDGRSLVTGGPEGTVRTWEVATGALRSSFKKQDSWILSLAFSPDGRTLAAGDRRSVTLWDPATGVERASLVEWQRDVRELAFAPDGATLASVGASLMLWDLRAALAPRPDEGHLYEVNAVAYAPDGKTLASASQDRTVKLWDLATRKPRATLRGHTGEVLCVAYAPDGRTIASAGDDATIRLWDASGAGPPITLKGHAVPVHSLAFSPDGRWLASGGGDDSGWNDESGEVKLWDRATGRSSTLMDRVRVVDAVAFAPDSATLAIGRDDDTIVLWDLARGRPRAVLSSLAEGTHSDGVLCLAFSPDGKHLASGSRDQNLRLWDLTAAGPGEPIVVPHDGQLFALDFSPDGKALAVGGWNRTLVLRGVPALELILAFPVGDDRFPTLAFSPDGRSLATGHTGSDILVWDLSQGRP